MSLDSETKSPWSTPTESEIDAAEEWAEPMEDHLCQPWDCESRHHSVIVMDRVSSSPWLCKIDNEFYKGKYLFTVDDKGKIVKKFIVVIGL